MKSLTSNFTKLLFVTAFLFCNNVFAQGVSDALRLGEPGLGSDARALGMGNSYIGLSDDGGAAFFNPAGWGLIKKIEISGGLSINGISNNTQFMEQYSDKSSSNTQLNNFSLALPFPTVKGSFVVGLAYHTTKDFNSTMKFSGLNTRNSFIQFLNNSGSNIPYDLYLTDLNYNTPLNNNLNQSGTIDQSGSINNWTFSAAIEAYKNLYLGLNVDFISGSYNNINNYYEDDLQGIYSNVQIDPTDSRTNGFQTFNLERTLNWDLSGWDAKFGLLYQIKNSARLGLTVQFPKTFTINEKYTVDGYSLFSTGFNPALDESKYSDNVKYDIVTPFELSGGLSYNILNLILSGQITYIDYSQLKFQNADGLSTSDVNNANNDIQNLLRAVVNFNLGAEYTFPDLGFRLRGGFIYMPSAYQGDPSQYDKKYFTLGAGYLIDGAVGIDVAYAHGWWKTYGDNYGVNLSRTFQSLTNDQVFFSMTYRF
jgi:hypothetical protein